MQQKMRFPFRVSRDCLGRCFVFVRHSLSCFHRNRVAFQLKRYADSYSNSSFISIYIYAYIQATYSYRCTSTVHFKFVNAQVAIEFLRIFIRTTLLRINLILYSGIIVFYNSRIVSKVYIRDKLCSLSSNFLECRKGNYVKRRNKILCVNMEYCKYRHE